MADDLDAGIQFAIFDDQRLRDERFDGVRRDARHHLLDRLAIDGRLQFAGAGTDLLAKPEARRAARHVEEDDIARIDQVRVLDLVPVHLPDFRPAPRLFQEFAGNVPQGVTLDDDMAIRRVVDELQRVGGGCADGRHGQDERGYNANHSRNLSCRWNAMPPMRSQ
jgi:hypothetical protein